MPDVREASLVVEKGMQGVRAITLAKAACVLGSSPEADVVVANPYVSRLHARIGVRDGRFHIGDLGSRNGTFVNGSRLGRDGLILKNGDRVELAAGQVVLRFHETSVTLTLEAALRASTGGMVVDPGSRDVWVRGALVEPPLSRKEFDVLDLLFRRAGKACSRHEIAETGWPERTELDVGDQEIDQCIRRLRLRIEPEPSKPQHIITVRGYGYKLAIGR